VIKELDRVVVAKDLPGDHLVAGDIGTVVMVRGGGTGYEVEFMTLTGETLAVVTIDAAAIRAIAPREIAHVREVA